MENYKLETTEHTPFVDLNFQSNSLTFEGESRPENVQEFYRPIIEWIEQYSNHVYFLKDKGNSAIDIKCDFKFEYFNSSSAKYIMDIMNKLSEIHKSSEVITLMVNWYYDEMDEDMKDAGEEFEDIVNIKFNFMVN